MRGNKKREKNGWIWGEQRSKRCKLRRWWRLGFFLKTGAFLQSIPKNSRLKNVGRLCYVMQQTIVGIKSFKKVGVFHEVFPSFYTKRLVGFGSCWKDGMAEMLLLTDLANNMQPIYLAFVGNIVKWIEMIDDLNEVSWSTQEKPPNTRPVHVLWTSKWLRT